MTARDHAREAAEPATGPSPKAATAPGGPGAGVLALQRTVGNAGVVRYLRGRSLQRTNGQDEPVAAPQQPAASAAVAAQPGAGAAMEEGPTDLARTAAAEAERRLVEMLEAMDAVLVLLSLRPENQAALDAGTALRARFDAILAHIRNRVSGVAPAGLALEPSNPGTMGERARTDIAAGRIHLFQRFFDSDLTTRSATLIHESVHAVYGVDDIAYKTTRAFDYLTDAARLRNPDSFVALIEDMEGRPPRPESLTAAEVVPGEVRDEAEFHIAMAQHVLQRASYLFDAIAGEARVAGSAAQWSERLKWFMSYVNNDREDTLTAPQALGQATRSAAYCRTAAMVFALPIVIDAVVEGGPAEGWRTERGELHLTYRAGPQAESIAWLVESALAFSQDSRAANRARVALACVQALEPSTANFAR